MTNTETLRCENDRELFERLSRHPDVVRTREQIENLAGKGSLGVRRRLLATSVRLGPAMAADIHRVVADCAERLQIAIPIELYVFPEPRFNAACFRPEEGRLFIMFSSGLLEAFDDDELRFVAGHELAHHLYLHHDIPVGPILQGASSPQIRLTLELFAWSRYAEISADRAGAHCAGELGPVARALFRLASGLSGRSVEFSLETFLGQVDEMQSETAGPGQGGPAEDWFSTHPFSPLRVKALQLYFQSELAQPGGMSKDELEIAVHRLMLIMEPSYIEGRTETAEVMRRALFAGALVVAAASGDISDTEIAVFEEFFGKGTFRQQLDLRKLEEELPKRLQQARSAASVPQRMQLVHDICLIARAEGEVLPAERLAIESIADGLGVSRGFVLQTLDASFELD